MTIAARLPWTDRRGRFSPLRAATLMLLLLPAFYYLGSWATGTLGARPLHGTLRAAGFWTVWILLSSLAITPARAALSLPQLPALRRMVGLGAMFYALGHFILYWADQGWRPLHVVSEIALRFYLTIGFVALLGLVLLGWTSTDAWVRRLGAAWKRLHRLVYAVALLGSFHFMLQSKADVQQAMLAAGLLAWLLLWRLLPAGRDRSFLPLLGLALAAGGLTLIAEWTWFRFATHLDPWRVVKGELVLRFGPRPAVQVATLGVTAACAAELRRLAVMGHGTKPWFPALAYATGGILAELALIGLHLAHYPPHWGMDAVWIALFAMLGAARIRLPQPRQRWWLDLFYTACILHPLWMAGMNAHLLGPVADGVVALMAVILAARIWTASRPPARGVGPRGGWGAVSATTLL